MPTTITRTNMSPFIALAKIGSVVKLLNAATAGNLGMAAANTHHIYAARQLAKTGQSIAAFQRLARATVPANSVRSCCMLHSAQYGCGTHGYPRVR